MAVISIPKSIRDVLGEEGSKDLVDIFDKISEDKKLGTLEFVEEKFERRLTDEMAKLRTEDLAQIRSDSVKIDKRITEEIAKLDKRITEEAARLDNKISEAKADII